MHIGIDCRLPYYRSGGISQYVLSLVRALAKVDTSSRYSILHSRLDTASRVPSDAANMRRIDVDTPCHHRYERMLLGAELKALALDVLHSPDFVPPATGARRRVISVHDLAFLDAPERLTDDSLRYYRDQLSWALEAADHVVTPSHATRADLLERFSMAAEKVTTIPLAASTVYLEPSSSEQIAATLERRGLSSGFVLFVGTIEPRKNLGTLLEIHRCLHADRRLSVPLVVVGRPGWANATVLSDLRKAAQARRVSWLADVADLELRDLYSAAGLLAMPSLHEGFGLPALEAMHCGCPVVASRRGALPEVVGDAGILLEPNQIDEWVAAFERLLMNVTARASFVEKGRRRAAQFSWHRVATTTLEVYRGVSATA